MKIIYIPNRIIDSDGIADGATVHVYQSGTTTHVNIYSDPTYATPMANPFTVGAGAEFPTVYTSYSGDVRLYIENVYSGEIQDTDPYNLSVLSETGFVFAKDYGVSSSSSDNYAALTTAIAGARAAKKPLMLPAGTLTINQASPNFALESYDQIYGIRGLTQILCTGLGPTGELFSATGKTGIRLSGFKIAASVLQTNGQVAVSLKDCTDCVVEDCIFDKWTDSVIFWTALVTGPVPPQSTNCRNKAIRCVSLSSRQYGFYMNFATACEFLNCEAYNSSAYDGFKTGGGTMFAKISGCHSEGNAGDGFDTYDGFIASTISDCTSYNNTSNGFQFKGTFDGTYTAGDYVTRESTYSGLVAKGNGLAGFLFQEMRLGAASGLSASRNGTSGIVVNNVQGMAFSGCSATRNTQHGWSIIGGTSRCVFSGCVALDNSWVDGTTQNGTYDGWNISSASTCWFNGCISNNGTAAGLLGGQGYGFNLLTSTGNTFSGGGCSTNVTGAVGGTSPLTGNNFFGFDLASQPLTTPSVQAVASAATVTPTFGNDLVKVTAQAVALTLANPTGTAVSGKRLTIRLKDNGTGQTIAYGTQYRAVGVTLPTTTVANKTHYLEMVYNSDATKWDVIRVNQEA